MTCKNIAASIRWYQEVLGFGVDQTWEVEGKLAGAIIRAGDIQIVLNQDDGKLGWDRIKGQGLRSHCTGRRRGRRGGSPARGPARGG